MREQQVTFRATGTIQGQTLFGNSSQPEPPDPVRLRQREALADLGEAWGAGQPVGSGKRLGVLAKALGFFNNLW